MVATTQKGLWNGARRKGLQLLFVTIDFFVGPYGAFNLMNLAIRKPLNVTPKKLHCPRRMKKTGSWKNLLLHRTLRLTPGATVS